MKIAYTSEVFEYANADDLKYWLDIWNKQGYETAAMNDRYVIMEKAIAVESDPHLEIPENYYGQAPTRS